MARVQLRQEEDVIASSRKTAKPALDGGRDLVLDFATQAITNALGMQRNIKDIRLQDFRPPNSALSYSPIRLSAFKL